MKADRLTLIKYLIILLVLIKFKMKIKLLIP